MSDYPVLDDHYRDLKKAVIAGQSSKTAPSSDLPNRSLLYLHCSVSSPSFSPHKFVTSVSESKYADEIVIPHSRIPDAKVKIPGEIYVGHNQIR